MSEPTGRRAKTGPPSVGPGKFILIERPSNAPSAKALSSACSSPWTPAGRFHPLHRDEPTGMTDMMFGVMRAYRTEQGEWVVPAQGSGDYQGDCGGFLASSRRLMSKFPMVSGLGARVARVAARPAPQARIHLAGVGGFRRTCTWTSA